MDDATFNMLLASMDTPAPAGQAAVSPPKGPAPTDPNPQNASPRTGLYQSPDFGDASQDAAQDRGELEQPVKPPQATPEPGLSDPSAPLTEAPLRGFAKAIYESKDFVAGETPQQDRSAIRKAVDAGPNAANAGLGYSLAEGVSQFATGMLGVGKLIKGAKLASSGVAAAYDAAHAVRGGAWGIETAKAAVVGSAAFDPHNERISNLVQSYPMLANPITSYLAAKPGDSAAEGRLKNAIESVGMDTLGLTLVGSLKLYKGLRTGDAAEIAAGEKETHAALDGQDGAPPSHPDVVAGAPAEPVGNHEPGGGPPIAPEPAPAAGEAPTSSSSDGERPAGGPGAPSNVTEAPNPPDSPDGTVNLGEITVGAPADKPGEVPPAPASPEPPAHIDHSGREFTKAGPGEPYVYKAANDNAGEAVTAVDRSADADNAAMKDEAVSGATAPATAPKDDAAPLTSSTPESVTQVSNATQAGAPPGSNFKPLPIADHQVESIYQGIKSDMEAFEKFGDWQGAIANGHVFGKGGSIPYQKLVENDDLLSAVVDRAADTMRESFDKMKGGAVQSDAAANRFVAQRLKLYGEDPASLLGLIQKAGADAKTMVANMEASYAISQRAYQDAAVLAGKIKIGALHDYGGLHEDAMAHLKQMLTVANSAWSAGQSVRSNMGRGMRRLRPEFRPDQGMLDALKTIPDNRLVEMLNTAGTDPRLLRTAMRSELLKRAALDGFQALYVNNLLWGFRTHVANFVSNGYMLLARPMERILGSYAQSLVKGEAAAGDALRIRREALHQYTFMASSILDAGKAAVETWRLGDSLLSPHENEYLNAGVRPAGMSFSGPTIAQLQFRPWDSMANILYNALAVAAPKTLTLPTRAMGTADELVKQVVYRSQLQAKGVVEGASMGLEGQALKDFVKNRLYNGFDSAGRAIDADALREAQVSTFQQKLEPGTSGAALQSYVSSFPLARFILPFVKTPTNVLRLGWKMTPILNMAQKEFRQEAFGHLGAERQAQAIGQLAMGTLMTFSGAWLAAEGYITGGGPSDPKALAALKATGWQPYSFVWTNGDGSKEYINYGRYDPVAMPLGIIADVVNVLSADPDSSLIQKSGTMIQAAAIGIVKNISGKSYLKSLDDTIQAITDPDRNAARVLGNYTSNLIPMSSALRFAQGVGMDPVLHDARTYADYILATLPGVSQGVPPKRDMFGDPEFAHVGLWVDSPASAVDAEIRRLASTPGEDRAFGAPSPRFRGGVDLHDVTMVDGRNAYDVMQQLARKPMPRGATLKEAAAKIMQTRAYARAPDGDAKTPGTKMAMIAGLLSHYRGAAERMMLTDKNVRDAAFKNIRAAQAAYANRPGAQNPTDANAQGAVKASAADALTRMVSPLIGGTMH